MRILRLRGFVKSQFEKKVIICYNLVIVWKCIFHRVNPFELFVNERGSVSSQWRGISEHSCFPNLTSLVTLLLESTLLCISFLLRPWLFQSVTWVLHLIAYIGRTKSWREITSFLAVKNKSCKLKDKCADQVHDLLRGNSGRICHYFL